MRGWAIGCVLLGGIGAARGDTSVGKPAASGATNAPNGCVAAYLKEAKLELPVPATPTARTRGLSFHVGAKVVKVEVPVALDALQTSGSDLVQLVPLAEKRGGDQPDLFPDWGSVLQIRFLTQTELEALVKTVRSDFMGTTRQTWSQVQIIQGQPEEFCAVLRRTPGHATMLDGRHRAMPDIVEIVHGFLLRAGDKTLTWVYRLSASDFEQLMNWERTLASVKVE